MSELGCTDVAGNGWGEEAAGDERAWLRGRHGCKAVAGNGSGERAWKMVACQLAM